MINKIKFTHKQILTCPFFFFSKRWHKQQQARPANARRKAQAAAQVHASHGFHGIQPNAAAAWHSRCEAELEEEEAERKLTRFFVSGS